MQNKSSVISNVREVDGPQIIKFGCMKGVVESGGTLVESVSKMDLLSSGTDIIVQSTIVSNLSNERLLVPTSMNKENRLRVSFWSDDMNWIDERAKLVKNSDELDEVVSFNEKTNLTAYQDYPDVKELSKALKLESKELSELPTEVRNTIAKKMSHSRGNTSRITRFVIAAMYEYCLHMKGGETDIVGLQSEADDMIAAYEPNTLAAMCTREDMAYVTCDRPRDSDYMAFQYIISREFPFEGAMDILRAQTNEGLLHSQAMMNIIEEEAPFIGMICDGDPSWNGRAINVSFDASRWHGYVVNYARAIGCEGFLDEAYAIASVLMQSHHLANVSLPRRRSTGELFRRSMSTKQVDGVVPNMGQMDEVLLGGYCVASGCLAVYKEIISHDKMTSSGGGVDRTIISQIIKGRSERSRWYRFLNANGMDRCAAVIERIDFLDFDIGARWLVHLDNEIITPHWGVSPLDFKSALSHGFLDSLKRCSYQIRAKLDSQTAPNRAKTLGLLVQLGLMDGDKSKSSLTLRAPRYRRRQCRVLETWLHPGDVSVLKGGVRVVGMRPNKRAVKRRRRVVAPREFAGDEDGIVWDNDSEHGCEDDNPDSGSCSSSVSSSACSDWDAQSLDGGSSGSGSVMPIRISPGNGRRVVNGVLPRSSINDLPRLRGEAASRSSGAISVISSTTDAVLNPSDAVEPPGEIGDWDDEPGQPPEPDGRQRPDVVIGGSVPGVVVQEEEEEEGVVNRSQELISLVDGEPDLADLIGSALSNDVVRQILANATQEVSSGGGEGSEHEFEYDLSQIDADFSRSLQLKDYGLSSDRIISVLEKRMVNRVVNEAAHSNIGLMSQGNVGHRNRDVRNAILKAIDRATTSDTGSLVAYDNEWLNKVVGVLKDLKPIEGETKPVKHHAAGFWARLSGTKLSRQRATILLEKLRLCADAGAEYFKALGDHVGISGHGAYSIFRSYAFKKLCDNMGYAGLGTRRRDVNWREAELLRRMVSAVNKSVRCSVQRQGALQKAVLINLDSGTLQYWISQSSRGDMEGVERYDLGKETRFCMSLLRLLCEHGTNMQRRRGDE